MSSSEKEKDKSPVVKEKYPEKSYTIQIKDKMKPINYKKEGGKRRTGRRKSRKNKTNKCKNYKK